MIKDHQIKTLRNMSVNAANGSDIGAQSRFFSIRDLVKEKPLKQ